MYLYIETNTSDTRFSNVRAPGTKKDRVERAHLNWDWCAHSHIQHIHAHRHHQLSCASAPIKKGLHNFANFLFFIARGRWQIGLLALHADCQGAELTVRPLDGMQTLATKGGQCAAAVAAANSYARGGPWSCSAYSSGQKRAVDG